MVYTVIDGCEVWIKAVLTRVNIENNIAKIGVNGVKTGNGPLVEEKSNRLRMTNKEIV